MHQDDPQPMCCWPRRARRSKAKAKAKRGTAVPSSSQHGAAASSQGGSGKTTPLLQAVGQSSHLPPTKPIQVKSPPSPGDLEQVASPLSIADFHDCREDFSVVADGDSQSGLSPHPTPGHSPRTSMTNGQSGKAAGIDAVRLDMAAHTNGTAAGAAGHSAFSEAAQQQEQEQDAAPSVERQQSFCSTDAPAGASESSEDTPPLPLGSSKRTGVVGCLAILDSIRHGSLGATAPEEQLKSQRSKKSAKGLGKPDAGCSIPPRDFSLSVLDVREQCEDAPATTFQVRSQDYMRTKLKVKSTGAMYRLVAADVFTFPQRQFHIAKLVNLPPAPAVRHLLSGDTHIPPLLIFNLQLPLYPATLFGSNDGVGHTIVYYFALPEDFDPATFENQKALSLFKRFVQNGREADGSMTRDRLKLIPRVANPDEWCQKGPLSSSEHKLLVTYNDKPILTRPQHAFFKGANYLEVDLDIHSYAFLARKALGAFLPRLKEVVFENAFVIQGNAVDELPEQILGVARMYRVDLTRQRPFDSFVPRSVAPIAEEAGGQAGEHAATTGRDDATNGVATPANGVATSTAAAN